MGLLGPMLILTLGNKKIPTYDYLILYRPIYIIMVERGYKILVTKICNRGRISYISTNFIPNISALNRKH